MILGLESEKFLCCLSLCRVDSRMWSRCRTLAEPRMRILQQFLSSVSVWALPGRSLGRSRSLTGTRTAHSETHLLGVCAQTAREPRHLPKKGNQKRPLTFHESSWTLCLHGFRRVKPKRSKNLFHRVRRQHLREEEGLPNGPAGH